MTTIFISHPINQFQMGRKRCCSKGESKLKGKEMLKIQIHHH